MIRFLQNTLKKGMEVGYRAALAQTLKQSAPHENHVIRIQPSRGWGSLQLQEVWEYRDLIYFMLWSDIKSRYRQMALGPLWIIIQPLFTVITSTVIFSVLAKLPSDGIPYPLFNYTALLPWTFFTGAVGRATGSLLGYQHLISKVYFPRLILPIISVVSGLLDFVISFLVLLVIAGFYGFLPSLRLVFVPFFLGIAMMVALAIGFWLAALLVRFRDIGAFIGYFLQAWMYASPIVYPASLVPEQWQFLYYLNPMAGAVTGLRWAVLGTNLFPIWPVLLSASLVLVILFLGAYFYRSTERTIIDIL